jgi:hypothetical protein
MKIKYEVRQMTDNKIVKRFDTLEEAEKWLKETFKGITEVVKYYVSLPVIVKRKFKTTKKVKKVKKTNERQKKN